MANSVIFIGCGDIAIRCAKILHQQKVELLGVRRNVNQLPTWLPSHSANVLNPSSLGFLTTSKSDTIIYSLSAATFDEKSYTDAYLTGIQNVISSINNTCLRRLIFVSSTSVYHQNDDSWVNETSETRPQRFNGQIMLEAEKLVRQTSIGTCLRFSGIYGPRRLSIIDRVRHGLCATDGKKRYTNRIHADDCGGILAHLAFQSSLPEVLLGTDSLPAHLIDVENFIASELGIQKKLNDNTNHMARRGAGSKRCNNQRLLDTGYTLEYPDYRAGYRKMIKDGL